MTERRRKPSYLIRFEHEGRTFNAVVADYYEACRVAEAIGAVFCVSVPVYDSQKAAEGLEGGRVFTAPPYNVWEESIRIAKENGTYDVGRLHPKYERAEGAA